MAYVPNATTVTEPIESRSVESAALEFRTLKEYVVDLAAQVATEDAKDLRVPESTVNPIPAVSGRAGKVLGFDAAGQPVAVAVTGTEDPSLRSDLASSSGSSLTGFTPAGIGAVATTVQTKLRELTSPKDYGAVGDGTTNDTSAFTTLETVITGNVVDLGGAAYKVSAYPSGNAYINGSFIVSGTTLVAAQNRATISCNYPITDTGALDSAYSGGVQNTLVFSGRTTPDLYAMIASQSSRASGPARAVCIGSIYSWAKGNVSGVYSSRQSSAVHAQSFALGTEECEGYGTRSGNVSSVFCRTEGLMGLNLASRRGYMNNIECSVNIASRDTSCGAGHGAVFEVVTSGGVNGSIIEVKVLNGGFDYDASPTINFYDRGGIGSDVSGSGATAVATVVDGVIQSVLVTNGGVNYSEEVLALAQVSTQCHANVASRNSKAKGELSGTMFSEGVITTNYGAGAFSSQGVTISGMSSASLGAGNSTNPGTSTITGSNSVTLAAQTTNNSADIGLIGGSWICDTAAGQAGTVVLGSRRVLNNVTRSVCGGNSSSGSPSTANRKWQLFSDTGNIQAAGTFTGSTTFTDYAEYFENVSNGPIPLGTIVSLVGRKVRPTKAGDDILGVVSATALIAAGDSPFTWSKRYMTGEFGEVLYHKVECVRWSNEESTYDGLVSEVGEIPENAERYSERVPVENPDFDPSVDNVPRSQRPDEWTCVGLLGQVHVRVAADVQVGDYVAAGDGGIGIKSATPTNMRCMEIRKPFDDGNGYAVAFCLVR